MNKIKPHGRFKDLARRTSSGKALRDKAFSIAENPKYDGYQRGLASRVYKFFDINSSRSSVNNKIKQNQKLAEELHKPIVKDLKKKSLFFIERQYFGCWFSWYAINR